MQKQKQANKQKHNQNKSLREEIGKGRSKKKNQLEWANCFLLSQLQQVTFVLDWTSE